MSDIKKRVAIEKDSLKPFGVNNVERQIMVSNPIEEENPKPFTAESSTQLAEKKLVVRIIYICIDETRDLLII